MQRILYILLLSLTTTFTMAVPKVKVGFYPLHGYHDIDAKGVKSGYGYSFLQLIRRYCSVTYEYCGTNKTWNESLEMLKDGEIDLLTGAHKTRDREKYFDFSLPIGTNSINIIVRHDEKRYIPEQYKTYNGMTIGFVSGDVSFDKMASYAAKNGFTFKPVFFKEFKELYTALKNRTLDAICESSLLKLDNKLKTLDSFDNENIYAIVRKGNRKLLTTINNAIEQLDNTERDWMIRTNRQNYYDGIKNVLDFSEKEKAFIRHYSDGKHKLVVATDNDWKPYSWYENGTYKGIGVDYWNELMKMVGMDYEFYISDKPVIGTNVLDNKKVDIYILSSLDKQQSEDNGFIPSPVFLYSSIALLKRKDVQTLKTIALSATTPEFNKDLNFPDSIQKKVYPDTETALNAVIDGEADGLYLYNYVAQLYTNGDKINKLSIEFLQGYNRTLRMVVREGTPPEFMSILSKCIYHFNGTDMNSLIAKNLRQPISDVSWLEFVREHFWSTSAFALFIILGIFIYKRRQDAKVSRENENARKAAEEARIAAEEARKAAEEASRSKTAFLFNMSHDIRTPMNAIIGFTELLKKNTLNEEKRVDYIDKISKSSNVLLSIINNVLEMARIENGNQKLEEQPYYAGSMTGPLYTIFDEMMREKQITFTHTQNIEHPYIYCDVQKLREVLLNVLSNAYKYTPSGGHVKVETIELPSDKPGCVMIRTTISDDGIGMSEEYQKILFEEFTREHNLTETKIDGTGLGMAIVKKYLDIMGGTITVKSKEGVGTTFIIDNTHRIARKEDLPADVALDVEHTNNVDKRILMAEDNELNAEIACEILSEVGFIVERAENGRDCVEKLSAAPPHYYSLILMDIQMPEMDGYEATRAIRALDDKEKASIPIIAMTANAFEEDKKDAMEAGMNAHIAKPIDVDVLLTTLSKQM